MQYLNWKINSSTRLICVIGSPIEHSLSPIMQNEAFKSKGLNYVYLAFNIKPNGLKAAIEGFKVMNVKGFNVTIPHKVSIITYLDSLDETALDTGAVNTVVNDNGRFIGYNTDVKGFIEPLKRRISNIQTMKVIILGSGGAARACVSALIREGCKNITILARTISKAEDLVTYIYKRTNIKCSIDLLIDEKISKVIKNADIIVNATPIGMYPNINESPIPLNLIKPNMIVYDIVYNPLKTKLIKDAEAVNAITIPGYEMLVEQGAASFRLWTGIEPPKDIMERVVIRELKGGEIER
ncbi:MAG: shikimate dehydrogenase [Nitrososphaerales archaeon]